MIGGGWNLDLIHRIQFWGYGYPVFVQAFYEEILPDLVDVGGGSGPDRFYYER